MSSTDYAEVDEQLGADIWKKTEVNWEEILGLSMMVASKRYVEQLCAVQDKYRETWEKPKGWHQQYEYILDTNGDMRLSHDRMSRGEGFSIESFALMVKGEKGGKESAVVSQVAPPQPMMVQQPEEKKKPGFFGKFLGKR